MINKSIIWCVSFSLALVFWGCSAHKDSVFLSNKFHSVQKDSIIREFVNSDSLFSLQSNFVIPFEIYMFGGKWGNYILLDTHVIDTTKFNVDYFVEKCFIYDFMEKDINDTSAFIRTESTYLYNALTNHTQKFGFDIREWHPEMERTKSLREYLYDCFPQEFYDLIGSLIYNKTLDYVFAYPTRVTHDEGLIGTDVSMYFGVKGKDVFVIIDNWTDENQGNNPQIIPIENYLECCWEKMTNVSKK